VALLPGVVYNQAADSSSDSVTINGQHGSGVGLSDGRRQQQRRPARRELGRPGAAPARSDSGIPGRHQPVRRRVRRRHRRRRQRRHQAGHRTGGTAARSVTSPTPR
jgi:hypothetical protein